MFKHWDWHDTLCAVGLTALTAVLTGLFVLFMAYSFADKHVDSYYLSYADGSHSAVCVKAHWVWNPDEVAFCTDDKDKALDFVTRANASLKH